MPNDRNCNTGRDLQEDIERIYGVRDEKTDDKDDRKEDEECSGSGS